MVSDAVLNYGVAVLATSFGLYMVLNGAALVVRALWRYRNTGR